MSSLSYIPNDFARTWVQSQIEAKRGVHVPIAYIDINEGKRVEAELFAQIMYWHEPSKETGETRLRRERDGYLWATKNHADWWKEARIKYNTARVYLKRLEQRGLIFTELHGEKGKATTWVRVNWDEFERRMRIWMENDFANKSEKQCEDLYTTIFQSVEQVQKADTVSHGTDIVYHGDRYSISEGLIQNSNPNTESTSENTTYSLRDARAQDNLVNESVSESTDTPVVEKSVVESETQASSDSQKLDIVQEAEKHLDDVGAELPKPKKANKQAKPRKPREPDRIWNGVCLMSFKMDPKSESPVVEAAIEKNKGRIGKVVSFLKSVGATPEDLFRFYRWYQNKYPHLDPPKDDAKFSSNWSEFKEGDPTAKLSSRPSHKKVAATQSDEISPEDQAAALAHIQSFKLEPASPPIAEKAAGK